MDLGLASFDVEILLTLKIDPESSYKAKAKLCACPFCLCRDGEKEKCTFCVGTGILIKLNKPLPKAKLVFIRGGKS